jgi:hypothetical protein
MAPRFPRKLGWTGLPNDSCPTEYAKGLPRRGAAAGNVDRPLAATPTSPSMARATSGVMMAGWPALGSMRLPPTGDPPVGPKWGGLTPRRSARVIGAYVLIQTEVGKVAHVARALSGLKGVQLVEDVTGLYDVIARIQAPVWISWAGWWPPVSSWWTASLAP